MATYSTSFLGQGTYFVDITETAVSGTANTSTIAYTVRLVGNNASWDFDTRFYSVTYDGVLVDAGGSFTYDFRVNNTPTLGSGSKVVTHNADGSKTVAVVSGFSGGSASGSFATTYIPQVLTGPTLSVSGGVVSITSAAPSQTGTVTGYDFRRSTDNATWTTGALSSGGTGTFSATRGVTWYFQTRAIAGSVTANWSPSTSIFVPSGGKRWTGSAWTPTATAKRWTGSAWTDLTIAKRWSGSAWVDLS